MTTLDLTANFGIVGPKGPNGWTPEFALVADGARECQQVIDWTGSVATETNPKPATGMYVGLTGFVTDIADAIDLRGAPGDQGDAGAAGGNGWTPVFSLVADGSRIVQQVSDWTGGSGTKPAIGQYVSASGFTSNIANAVDLRGPGGSGNTPVTTIATSGASQALAFPATGNAAFDVTLTANCAITFTGGTAGQLQTITLILRQSGSGGFIPTFPAGVKWPSGTPPIPNTTLGKLDVITIQTPDAGATLIGSY